MNISLKFDRINDIPTLVQIMTWRRPGDKPLSEPLMVGLLMHICIIRPEWVNKIRFVHKLPIFSTSARVDVWTSFFTYARTDIWTCQPHWSRWPDQSLLASAVKTYQWPPLWLHSWNKRLLSKKWLVHVHQIWTSLRSNLFYIIFITQCTNGEQIWLKNIATLLFQASYISILIVARYIWFFQSLHQKKITLNSISHDIKNEHRKIQICQCPYAVCVNLFLWQKSYAKCSVDVYTRIKLSVKVIVDFSIVGIMLFWID